MYGEYSNFFSFYSHIYLWHATKRGNVCKKSIWQQHHLQDSDRTTSDHAPLFYGMPANRLSQVVLQPTRSGLFVGFLRSKHRYSCLLWRNSWGAFTTSPVPTSLIEQALVAPTTSITAWDVVFTKFVCCR